MSDVCRKYCVVDTVITVIDVSRSSDFLSFLVFKLLSMSFISTSDNFFSSWSVRWMFYVVVCFFFALSLEEYSSYWYCSHTWAVHEQRSIDVICSFGCCVFALLIDSKLSTNETVCQNDKKTNTKVSICIRNSNVWFCTSFEWSMRANVNMCTSYTASNSYTVKSLFEFSHKWCIFCHEFVMQLTNESCVVFVLNIKMGILAEVFALIKVIKSNIRKCLWNEQKKKTHTPSEHIRTLNTLWWKSIQRISYISGFVRYT